MGIRIDGASDQISAADGSLTIEGQSVNTTGIVTASGGFEVGTAATIYSTGNATFSGIVTASSYVGDGSALTGVAGTEITNSDFQVGVSTFMVDYSTGKIGIGTVVPAGLLEIDAASTTEMIMLDVAGVNFAKIGHNAASGVNVLDVRSEGHIRLLTGGNNERVRLDSSGRLLIGVTASTPTDNDANNVVLQVEGTAGDDERAMIRANNTTSGNGPFLYLARSRGTSLGSKTSVVDGDSLGGLIFNGADGSDDTRAASIQAFCDGTPGTDDMPGRLVFSTTADGAGNYTERMTLDSSGNLGIGVTSAAQKLHVKGLCAFETTNSTNKWINYAYTDNSYRFNYNGSGNDEIVFPSGGGLTFDGSTTAASTLDDYEEGSWTPNLDGLTNTPTWYNQTGRYQKVANHVHLYGFMQGNPATAPTFSSSGAACKITGIPFACSADAGYRHAVGTVWSQIWHWAGGNNNQNISQADTGWLIVSMKSTDGLQFFVMTDGYPGEVENGSWSDGDCIVEFNITYRTTA